MSILLCASPQSFAVMATKFGGALRIIAADPNPGVSTGRHGFLVGITVCWTGAAGGSGRAVLCKLPLP